MDDVAKNLSVSKKTLYQYFSDKDELVEEASKAHIQQEREELEQATRESSNAIEELYLTSKCVRKNIDRINPTVLFDLLRFYPKSYSLWQNFKDEFIFQSIALNLKQGIEDGYFRKEINLEILSRLRLLEIQLLFDQDVFPIDQYDFKEVQIQLFDHFVYGIVTEKGRALYLNYLEKDKKQIYA